MRKKVSTFKKDEANAKYKKYFENIPQNLVVNDRITDVVVETYDSFGRRLKGLMFRRSIPHNYGIVMPKCNAIHMFFVKFPLDIIFCDRYGNVVSLFPNFSKKITPSQKDLGAYMCYEFKVGVIEREEIKVGDKLSIYKKTFLRKVKKVR